MNVSILQRERSNTAVVSDTAISGSDPTTLASSEIAVSGLSLSPLMRQLLNEAAVDPDTLSPELRHQFAEIVVGIAPPTDLVPHASVASRVKRALDVVGAFVGIFILAVLFLPIGLAIKATSRGPVLFRQTRCGTLGAPFVMLKFRTMTQQSGPKAIGAEPGYEGKSASDHRITRVGRILRSTSLDELPQFLNVLRGEMSLVGTRPPLPTEVCNYNRRSWDRLQVRPGLTGQWQVNGRSEVKNFDSVVDLDMEYQASWSPAHDLVLLAKTVPAVLRRAGAV